MELTQDILDDRQSFEGIAERLRRQYEYRFALAQKEYLRFVETHKPLKSNGDGQGTLAGFAPGARPTAQREMFRFPKFDESTFAKDL